LVLLPAWSAAQGPRRVEFAPARPPTSVTVPKTGVAFVASAILPGAGQLLLNKDRWVPYLALELYAWASYAKQRSRARSIEAEYRELAWRVARRIDSIERRDSVFTYYEAMYKWHQSGAFDSDPLQAGLQPELDSTTYNGEQWRLARAQYLPRGEDLPPGTPQYQRALDYYRQNAIPPGYGWSWGESNLEQQVFGRLITDSDDAFRVATRNLGLILANHVVSAIDALVTARLQSAAEGGHQFRIGSELAPAGRSMVWTTTVRFEVGKKH
jgi:hypothetical protein